VIAALFATGAVCGGAVGYVLTTPQWPYGLVAAVGLVVLTFGLMYAEDPP
jgi:hypothetical protein